MVIFSEVTGKSALNTGTPHSTARIQIVQDSATMSVIDEFSFYIEKRRHVQLD